MGATATLPEVPGFTLAGDAAALVTVRHALATCLGALKAVVPILDDLTPQDGGAPDPEIIETAALVMAAIRQGEAASA
jgi:hypothetical protein